MKRLFTVVYEITNEEVWGKSNPLHYNHNGLQAVTVRMGDTIEELHNQQYDNPNAQPAVQTSETCPWERQDDDDRTYLRNPHTGEWMDKKLEFNLCPTCGKKIEVVE